MQTYRFISVFITENQRFEGTFTGTRTYLSLAEILVLVGGAIPAAVPFCTCTRFSARLKRVQEHSSLVVMLTVTRLPEQERLRLQRELLAMQQLVKGTPPRQQPPVRAPL